MILLEPDQPKTKILGKEWSGEFQIACEAYTSHPVRLQFRVRPDKDWRDAKYKGTNIQLAGLGEVLDIKLTRNFDYRLVTNTPGAEVHIAKHDIHE